MKFYLKKTGFTLIELLIVIAIIGIIVAITIPNLMVALQKGKQKVTMVDLKSVGVTIETYVVDLYHAPNATAGQLQAILEPFFIKHLPLADGWGRSWYYDHGTPGDFDQDVYSIASAGKDGIFLDWDQVGNYSVMSLGDFENDIIFSNGHFTYYPAIK